MINDQLKEHAKILEEHREQELKIVEKEKKSPNIQILDKKLK